MTKREHIRGMSLSTVAALSVLIAAGSCSGQQPAKTAKKPVTAVKQLTGVENLKKLLDTSGTRLLVFDLYADWCMPCKILSPMLEKIAVAHSATASFYKVNVDHDPEIAGAFGVQGIPFVVFVRDKVGLDALTGVHPEDAYVRTIKRLAAATNAAAEDSADTPDGSLVEGVRVITLTPEMAPGDLYVYRGETVRVVMKNVGHAHAISIPAYKVSAQAAKGQDLDVTFKAEEVGVFPIFCNGDCPSGDGSGYGRVVVMQYKGTAATAFTEQTAEQAKKLIAEKKPLLLDVRTPNEFYEGHIEGATLIPLQQLEQRIGEISQWKTKPVLVYCRSGNRSTVAAQILARNGFTTVYNLRPGIIGWTKAGYPTVTK